MTVRLASLAPWERSQLFDGPVWVDTHFGLGDDGRERVRAFFAAPDADATTAPFEGAQLVPLWTALRSVPRGDDLVINDGADGETLIADDEIDRELGGDRGEASILSFRARALWGSRWVLLHVGSTGRFFGTIPGIGGRSALPLWTDREAAKAALPDGAQTAQAYLLDVIAGGDDVDYAVDPQWGPGLYIDRKLRSELIETADLFPPGYFAQLGQLNPEEHAPFLEAAALAVAEARGAGSPFSGLWVIGYQLESAPSRVVFVVDSDDLDASAAIVVDAMNRQERRRERTETVRLGDLSPESQDYVRQTRNFASAT